MLILHDLLTKLKEEFADSRPYSNKGTKTLILDVQVFRSAEGQKKVVAESGNILGLPRMQTPSS